MAVVTRSDETFRSTNGCVAFQRKSTEKRRDGALLSDVALPSRDTSRVAKRPDEKLARGAKL